MFYPSIKKNVLIDEFSKHLLFEFIGDALLM